MGPKQSLNSTDKIENLYDTYLDKDALSSWTLPKEKYLQTSSEAKKAVLFFYGTFCPFH